MYLSDRDLAWAIETGRLIVDPPPERIDATSLDLHLGPTDGARIWDIESFLEHEQDAGRDRPELRVGAYKIGTFGNKYLVPPPEYVSAPNQLVGLRGNEIIVKPRGFNLWPTQEVVGTPKRNADLICFVDGKSTKARAGMVVHLTAPTIHSTWEGNVTLEIANLGPFDLVFKAGDAVAQLTVSKITSAPDKGVDSVSMTYGQSGVHGRDIHRSL